MQCTLWRIANFYHMHDGLCPLCKIQFSGLGWIGYKFILIP